MNAVVSIGKHVLKWRGYVLNVRIFYMVILNATISFNTVSVSNVIGMASIVTI